MAGRVIARQSETGYRASVDSVLLGCAVSPKPDETAVELGCGAGTAMLIAAWRCPQARIVGLEREPEMAALARENIAANAMNERLHVIGADALASEPERREAFDHAFANPPFFDNPQSIRPPRSAVRQAAFLTGAGGVAAWMSALLAAVPGRGRITVIHRAERLSDLLAALEGRAGEVRVLAVQPRIDAPAKRVLVTARKGVRTPMVLLPPLILHREDGSLTDEAAAIIQEGEELPLAM